ncbi:MAG: FAD-dependent oxidoreductase [Anaerolineae bacterium]|nr:FAD-dependent oxidoreductase [Anaerolineae bacterium]
MPAQKQLILVGGGHAHLYSLKYAHRFVKKDAQVTLVSPSRYLYYSGMGPGMISRIYKPDQLRFDLKALVESRGGTFIDDRVVAIDPDLRTLELESGKQLVYDLASFNVGSQITLDCTVSDQCMSFAVKPIENLEKIRRAILDLHANGTAQITVVGGGPAGIELAANITQLVQGRRSRSRTPRARITLVNSADRLLSAFPAQAARLAERSLEQHGVEIRHRFHVTHMASDKVQSIAGTSLECDIAVIATGIAPSRLFARSGLSTAPDGALYVNDCLQHPDHLEIFGGGDCIAIEGRPIERIGVHAVRQAPILFHNLLASLEEKAMKAFVPSQNYDLILNMGDGTGILIWKSTAWQSRLAFAIKQMIDTRFVARFQP